VTYELLRFAHLVGLMLIGGGLVGVFVCDLRSRQLRDLAAFAEAVRGIAVFYDGVVVPGALLLAGSGAWMIAEFHGGWDFLDVPWLAGMVGLFLAEFVEGNTVTRVSFMRLRRLAREAVGEGRITPELVRARGAGVATFTHFLDLPLVLVIVALGAMRPDDWGMFAVGIAAALAAATALTLALPRLYPWTPEPVRP
jgi:uncharacterized membrane protein